jgi:transposase InsO family protein
VAPSTYYAARDHAPSARTLSDAVLSGELYSIWEANRKVYGVRKLWKTARRAGISIGRDQTARLMRSLGIEGVKRSRRVKTTKPGETGFHCDCANLTLGDQFDVCADLGGRRLCLFHH